MRRSLLAVALAAALALPFVGTGTASADTYVDGYTRRDGGYVSPHWRSSPDHSTSNNWTSRGNQNPYTGSWGTRDPYPSYAPSYGSRSLPAFRGSLLP